MMLKQNKNSVWTLFSCKSYSNEYFLVKLFITNKLLSTHNITVYLDGRVQKGKSKNYYFWNSKVNKNMYHRKNKYTSL